MPVIDSNYLECKSTGSDGEKTVFLNGFRMKHESWNMVYPILAIGHSVFLFNRYGVGSSSKAKVDQVGQVVVGKNLTYSLLLHVGITMQAGCSSGKIQLEQK